MSTPFGVNLALKASLASESVASLPSGEDNFNLLPVGTPVSDTPGWGDPIGGDPFDLVLATGGGTQTGTTPTTGDVVIPGPTPGTADRTISAVLSDVTENVGMIAPFLQDQDNFLGLFYDPTAGEISFIQKLAGVETSLFSFTTALVNGDSLGVVVKNIEAWVTVNGAPVGTLVELNGFWTNQRPGLVVRNPLGVSALFIDSFQWRGLSYGYGYAYGLSYGN